MLGLINNIRYDRLENQDNIHLKLILKTIILRLATSNFTSIDNKYLSGIGSQSLGNNKTLEN